MKRVNFFLILVALVATGASQAHAAPNLLLGAQTVVIILTDRVNDGCWTKPGSARTTITNMLRDAGLSMTSEVHGTHLIVDVRAQGWKTKSGQCVVSYNYTVFGVMYGFMEHSPEINDTLKDIQSALTRLHTDSGLVVGQPTYTTATVNDEAIGATSDFIAKWLEANAK
jgi:hypothetical protein